MKKFLKLYAEKFSEFLKTDGGFLAALLALNSPPLFQILNFLNPGALKSFGADVVKGVVLKAVEDFYCGAAVILVFCLLIYCGLSKFPRTKNFLQTALLIGFAVSFVIDVFLIYTFQTPLHSNFIEIAVATNFNEAKEFFQAYVLKPKIIFAVTAAILLIAAAVRKLFAIFKNLSENNLRRLSYHSLIIFAPAVLASCYWLGSAFFAVAYTDTILFRNISNTYTALKIAGSESEILAEMNSQHEKIISDNSKIPYVVFVLGESARRDHMQLYGYNLQNNPLLTARYERGEIFKFNDVIACANHTASAMELIFTFSEKGDEKWYTTPNIFDILRRAGYHTVWISNQTPTSIWGNTDKVYSERCDEKFFEALQQKDSFTREIDGVLLPPLDNFISNAHAKNFYVIHLYGSHPVYNLRYPPEFEKFTAGNFEEKLTAEFDNTILYTDYILEEILKRFEDKTALIIYISDHGQELFEDGRNFMGHSDESLGNLGMIEIPMLIWASKSFRELYPEKIAAISAAIDKPYRTDLIPHTILDLMDIQTESFNPAKSIVNEKFDAAFERIYNGKLYTPN